MVRALPPPVAFFAQRSPAAWAGVVTIGVLLTMVQVSVAAGTSTPRLVLEPTAQRTSTTVQGADRFIRMCQRGLCSLVHTKQRLESEPVPARVLLPRVPSHAYITLFRSGSTTSAQVGRPLPPAPMSTLTELGQHGATLFGVALLLSLLVAFAQRLRRERARRDALEDLDAHACYRTPEAPAWARQRTLDEVSRGPAVRDAEQVWIALAALWAVAGVGLVLALV